MNGIIHPIAEKPKEGFHFVHRIPSELGEPVGALLLGDRLTIITNIGFVLALNPADSELQIMHMQVKNL